MDISVIIPVYGVERYIEQALVSLFTQTKSTGVEYILINDVTKDNSMQIARSVASRYPHIEVVYIDMPVNGGQAVARQAGIERATGEYTIHIDPDDWCEPTMLEDLYNKAKAEDADVVVCDYFVNYVNRELYKKQMVPNDGYACFSKLFVEGLHGALWNKLIKRELYIKNDIRFVPNINMWEDLLICAKIFAHQPSVSYLPKAFLHYRQRGGGEKRGFSLERVDGYIAAPIELERFLVEKNLDKHFERELYNYKINVKYLILRASENAEIQKRCVSLFPETDKYIDKYSTQSNLNKIALKQAVSGRLFIFNLIQTIASLKNKVSKIIQGNRYVVKY